MSSSTSQPEYTVRPTALAAARGGPELEDAVRAEVASMLSSPMYSGLKTPMNLVLHHFEWNNQDYILYPKDGVLVVDTCYFEKQERRLSEGPFKSYTLIVPVGESEGEDWRSVGDL